MIKLLIFVAFLSAVAYSQECTECPENAFFCITGKYSQIDGCGEEAGCPCACACFCKNNTDCHDGSTCKIPVSPVTNLYASTGACVDESFPGVAWDEEVPKPSSMVWLPIVIIVIVIILLIVAYMVWSKKNKEETAEDEVNDAKEMEPLSTEAV